MKKITAKALRSSKQTSLPAKESKLSRIERRTKAANELRGIWEKKDTSFFEESN